MQDLLQRAGLPCPEDPEAIAWWGAHDQSGGLLALAGVERYGSALFLRSVAVADSARKCGIGTQLVATVLSQAVTREISAVYLLTDSAQQFFARLGFHPIARAAAPAELAASDEWSSACPQSATLMELTPAGQEAVWIRSAQPGDAAAIARIYNQGIRAGLATFETGERSPAERESWLQNRPPRFRVLVADSLSGVRGWVSLNPFSPRAAYRFVADVSIYVDESVRGQGLGGRLLETVMTVARQEAFHKLVLTLFPENQAARKLYLGHGFAPVGILHQQGKINGHWRDTEVMECILGDGVAGSPGLA